MSTSRVIGEVGNLYASHGGCIDSMKAILAIDYAVECSLIDIDALNSESEKGCLFVARDGTIYDGVSNGEESEAHYKIVPTGLITKFNNVPLLASFYKDKNKAWQGVYVGTLDKLFETYKEFYKGHHDFSEQYIELCYGDRPLLNVYGFGLSEVVNNDKNYVFVPKEAEETVFNSGNTDSVRITVVDRLENLTKSLERAQNQLATTKLSKSKRKKLETRINQLKADIEKEEAMRKESVVTETATEIVETDTTVTNNVPDVEEAVVNTDTPVEEVAKPKRGRKPGTKNTDGTVTKKRTKTKAELEEELAETKQELADCKAKLGENGDADAKKNDSYDTYIESLRGQVAKLEGENGRLVLRNQDLLSLNSELTRQLDSARKANNAPVVAKSETAIVEAKPVTHNIEIKAEDITSEASEIMSDDFMETAGIKSACDIIFKKLIDKERWMSENGENHLRFYIKPLMQFVYNTISNTKVGDPTKTCGNGYVFATHRKKLLINTNLIDCYGNAIYIIDHTPHEKSYDRKTVTVMTSKSSLVSDGFAVEAIKQLPGHVKFFDRSDYIFSACLDDFDLEDEEHLNHIINERRCRFPDSYKDVSAKVIADKLKSSITQAIQFSEIDHNYILPMYNPRLNELEFLIPFYLDNHYGQRPELAIIVSKKQSFWKVFTVLKSEYAYLNSRLLGKTDSNVF